MNEASVETLLCIPHNQHRFKYKINDGSFHFVSKWDAVEFFSKYLPKNTTKLRLLQKLITSFLPFIMIPSEQEIFQLSKSQVVEVVKVRPLDNMSESTINRIKHEMDEAEYSERLPNDNLLHKLASKVMK